MFDMRHATCHSKHSLPKRSAATAVLVCLMVAALALSGCTIRLIGDYDDTIDKGVSEVQQKAELYFAKLLSTPGTPYDQSFYDDIDSRLAVLKSRAASLPRYPIIAEQITNLKSQFDIFQQLDKGASRPIVAGLVKPAESAITVSVESILKLELALKRGATGTSPPAPKK